MAVPKKRVPIPEDASEFWAWAEQQTSLPASLVLVVKDYIARHGDGDAINAFSIDNEGGKRAKKPRAETLKPDRPAAEEKTKPKSAVNDSTEAAAPTAEIKKPVVQEQTAPVQDAATDAAADDSSDSILAQLGGNSKGEEENSGSNSDDSADMLASMLNV